LLNRQDNFLVVNKKKAFVGGKSKKKEENWIANLHFALSFDFYRLTRAL
jgi:hypothetical protein